MLKPFLVGLFLFFLLIAMGSGGGSPVQAQAAIPWNCDDWQAFAHDDRTTAILESLAANRGKTLYCGVDQSDTFTKAETWAAGKDRNERDGTVYWGANGQRFRGFIAAQEGWLTDGESGLAGAKAADIFEFPRPEPPRRREVKRFRINGAVSSCGLDDNDDNITPPDNCPRGMAQSSFSANEARDNYNTTQQDNVAWTDFAGRKAKAECRRRGGYRVYGIAIETGRVSAYNTNDPNWYSWQMARNGANHIAYQVRDWSATCVKRIKRRQ